MMMVRPLVFAAAVLIAVAATGCGIKGPLVSAPKPEPTQDTAKPPAPAKP